MRYSDLEPTLKYLMEIDERLDACAEVGAIRKGRDPSCGEAETELGSVAKKSVRYAAKKNAGRQNSFSKTDPDRQ